MSINTVHAAVAEAVALRAALEEVNQTDCHACQSVSIARAALAQPSPVTTAAAALLEAANEWEASVLAVADATLQQLASRNFARRAALDTLLEKTRAYRAALNAAGVA